MPVFYRLISQYPTPAALAEAEHDDVVGIFQHLGLQNQRAKRVVEMAKVWCKEEPKRGRRFRRKDYPNKGDGRDVGGKEVLGDEGHIGEDGKREERVGWEVAHLPGVGAYGLDSWRIFCRDELRGLGNWKLEEGESAANIGADETHARRQNADEGGEKVDEKQAQHSNDHNRAGSLGGKKQTPASSSSTFEPEWKRVIPLDKELRAYLRWRWLKEGWVWDPLTGHRRKAEDQEMEEAERGGVIVEGDEGDKIEGKVEEEKEGKGVDKMKEKGAKCG